MLYQVVRIDQTIKKKELNKIENLVKSFTRAKEGNGRLHLLGLVSDGGVVSGVTYDRGPAIPNYFISTPNSTIL